MTRRPHQQQYPPELRLAPRAGHRRCGVLGANLAYPSGAGAETFTDDVVAAAMIDRLVHHAEVLTLSGDSYRTRARRELLIKDRSNAD